ncbi:hypothetical protein Pint_04644 [Pistacia integerrima]|uniref:Uncharacterized protein n=1 Tax=Pistacia integerrima TaxID=434235 RepID=A0ACC0Z193_9ROSI|nr:hypothetical protein Pint_04644 [Pistacia integerrima]
MATSELRLAMFPRLAFGHFIPFLHLLNNLAERGYKVSCLLPKGALPKLQQLNHRPEFIHFFPLVILHVGRLPPGAETASDVPFPLHELLASAIYGQTSRSSCDHSDQEPETPATQLEEKWDKWLNKFQPDSGVYYVFGSQITQQNEQFQEMVLGFELSGFPFLVALTPPEG